MVVMHPAVEPLTLYDCDLMAWYEDTLAKLRSGQLQQVDLDHLIEELEGLAGRDKRELKSRLEVLMAHLLKRIYIKSPNDHRGWELTIREQRRRLHDLLEQSPSLRNYWQDIFPETWQLTLSDLQEDYPETQFPKIWEFGTAIAELLSQPFWETPGK
jgi:Domain of unknown function DUF29